MAVLLHGAQRPHLVPMFCGHQTDWAEFLSGPVFVTVAP